MRSKHDDTSIEIPARPRCEIRGARSAGESPHRGHASHPEYPLERTCSNPAVPFQLTFARHAQQHFLVRPDLGVVASHLGLTLRAETEDALEAAVTVLRDLYGPRIRVGPPAVCYHQAAALEQPWMAVRVRCPAEHVDAVLADLVDREGDVVALDIEPGHRVVEACAPLAALLGYRAALEALTSGSAQLSMWLSHYAPVDSPPPGGLAA